MGCDDGRIEICDLKGKVQKSNFDRKTAIVCMDWDNHSPIYLLVGHKTGEILLIDTEKMVILQAFEKMASGF